MVNALYALLRSTKYLSIFWKENIDAATIEFNTSYFKKNSLPFHRFASSKDRNSLEI